MKRENLENCVVYLKVMKCDGQSMSEKVRACRYVGSAVSAKRREQQHDQATNRTLGIFYPVNSISEAAKKATTTIKMLEGSLKMVRAVEYFTIGLKSLFILFLIVLRFPCLDLNEKEAGDSDGTTWHTANKRLPFPPAGIETGIEGERPIRRLVVDCFLDALAKMEEVELGEFDSQLAAEYTTEEDEVSVLISADLLKLQF